MSRLNITEVYTLDDITHIIPAALDAAGFELLTMDLDKTLMGQFETQLPDDRIDFFKKVGRSGLEVALLSNAHDERISRVRYVASEIGKIVGRECLSLVPDDVCGNKKPNPDMFISALEWYGNGTPSLAIHVGDQVRSDVIAAERAGYRAAVLVSPMGEGDDPFVKFLGRPFVEPFLRRQRSLPDNVNNFPVALPVEAYRICK